MAVANRESERRTALWPYLLMPAIVVVVFYALYRVHRHPDDAGADAPTQRAWASGEPSSPR